MRDLTRTRENYREMLKKAGNKKYQFYPSDCQQILEMSLENGGGKSDIAINALEVGFMIGYRAAKNDMKRGKA